MITHKLLKHTPTVVAEVTRGSFDECLGTLKQKVSNTVRLNKPKNEFEYSIMFEKELGNYSIISIKYEEEPYYDTGA